MNILHLEDNQYDAALVKDVLGREWPDCGITLVTGREAFLTALHAGGYDIVLSDFQLPNFNGLEALEIVRAQAPHIPFIFFSGTIGEERAIEAVRAGAADYVIKDRMQRLPVSIQRVMRESLEQRARRRAEEALLQEQYLAQMLMENVPDKVYFKDIDSRFITVSRSMARRHGLTPAELRGKSDSDLFTEEHAREALKDEQTILRTGEPILDKEEKETWPDGTVTWALTSKLPTRDATGRIIGTFGVSRDITERKRQDEALRLFRNLVDRSNDAFEVVDPYTARFLDVSEKDCTDLGYTRQELLNLRIFDIDPTITPATWPALMESIRAHGFINGEGTHRRKNGATFPVELNARLVLLDREYLVVVARDITERKKTEEAMRYSARRFRALIESSSDAIAVVDAANNILYHSPAVARVEGYTVEELAGRNAMELTHPDDHPVVKAYISTLLEHPGRPISVLWRRRHKDGRWLWLEGMATNLLHDPAVGGIVTNYRDVTARKLADERIREQAEVIDQTPIAILVTDMTHRITYCNTGAAELYGLPREKMIGRTAEEILKSETLKLFQAARQETFAGGRWTGEIQGVNELGREIHTEVHMSLINDVAGRPRARLTIAIDITEKKKLESQFLRAQRLESLGMLAAGIAHDLNNVLSPVLMAAPLLRVHTTNESDLRVLQMIEHSAERGAALVRQILSFAHGAGGEKVDIQTKHLLRDIADLIQETFPKSVTLKEEIPNGLWIVKGNPTQLHQVLLNLCVNARDAMPEGGRLWLQAENRLFDGPAARAYPEANPGAYLVLRVSDTGTGIPPEIMAHIWEPFFTTKGEGKGTGLGLATVRGIVANHGGFVTVESAPGRGTTFQVFLPAAEQPAAVGPVPGSANPSRIRGQGELVLVVDDEVSIRELSVAILSRYGYRVITATNGIDAMGIYAPRVAEIALVISDFSMPAMGGGELAKALARLNPAVKILFVSGGGDLADLGENVPVTAPILQKPFTADQLLTAVRLALAAAPAQPPL